MAKKKRKTGERMLFVWFALAGVIILFAPGRVTGRLQLIFAHVFHRPLSIGKELSLSTDAVQSEDVVSVDKYNKLRNHLANTVKRLQQQRQRLEELSNVRDRFAWKGVEFALADIVTASADSLHSNIIINRGIDDGLDIGQFVIGDYSVVGTITQTDSRIAKVRLITDPKSKIPVKIGQLETGCIMQGCGNYDSAEIKLFPLKYPVCVGDVVRVIKKPGFLDSPVITGTVSSCRRDRDNPLFWDIAVSPACDIEKLNSVVVIVANPDDSGIDDKLAMTEK